MIESTKFIVMITFDNWGYNQYIADALEAKSHKVKHINFYQYRYRYPSIWHKIFNFFTKNLGIANLKHLHYHRAILKELENINHIDTAIYIKADFLSPKTIKEINKKCEKSVLLISDSIKRYPETKHILSLFDKVFSFEKKDCQEYNLLFKPNFIYNYSAETTSQFKYKIFNISSYDQRYPIFRKIGKCLSEMNIKYKIIIFTCREVADPYLEFSKKPLSIPEINEMMRESEILLDLHRNEQQGLSFRVFESLGLQKKLITTNKDIINYDFYNRQNIFVIEDIDNFSIPESFFQSAYFPIPGHILDKYLIENWVNELIV